MAKKKNEKFSGNVSLVTARKIFEALGFKTAGKWDAARLTKKIKNLANLTEGCELATKVRKQVSTIVRAQKKGRRIVVVDIANVAADRELKQQISDASKEAKQKAKKATEKKAKKKRIDCVCSTIKNLPKEGASLEAISKQANQEYVKSGGCGNEKQTHRYLCVVLPVLINFGIVTHKDSKLCPC